MKEKILDTVYKKLCEGFEVEFLTRKQFEKEFPAFSASLSDKITLISNKYEELKKSKNEELISPILVESKKYFVHRKLDHKYNSLPNGLRYISADGFSDEDVNAGVEKWKNNHPDDYELYEKEFINLIENEDEEIFKSKFDFIKEQILEDLSEDIKQENKSNDILYIKKTFFDHFRTFVQPYDDYYDDESTFEKTLLDNFKEKYLSNKYLQLFEIAEKYISRENFSGFDEYIVNVGERRVESDRYRPKNHFVVKNKDDEYSFTNTQDFKNINCEFVNIFVLSKNHLIKISVNLEKQNERTEYIVFKDFQKVNIVNECMIEIYMHKHFDPERIVFDTEDAAFKFNAKLTQLREGRRPFDNRR